MIWPRAKLGMAMLLLAEGVFFFMLLLAFVYFRDESLKTAAATLRLETASIYTACLLAGALTLWRGWTWLTILLGTVFAVGQGSEYLRLLRSGVTMAQGLFGTTSFTLTGIHEVHVLLGLVLLTALPRKQAAAMFWYFVVAVWMAVFGVVYLWTFL